jgi:flagellar motor switch protein FliN/FliY
MAEQTATPEETQQQAPPEAQGAAEQPAQPQAEQVEVHDAQFPEANDAGAAPGNGQIDMLLDAAMPVTVRLGEVEMLVRELLQLNQGQVITLTKRVGEPVDLYLRDRQFATGDLVVVGDRIGVRIREILSNPATGAPPA